MLTLLLFVAAQGTIQVDGLREGEGFRSLVSSEQVSLAEERFGRVIDAHTGFPVEGARIETWTEEISGPGQGFHRVGHARTGADGNFRVSVLAGDIRAEKIRVRAVGYLAFPGTVGDLELVRLMPKPDWTTRVQVVDLMDRPIENARITSTYSCAHDVPALEVRTGSDGTADLPEYGRQDQTGELRIRAAGYAAQKYIDRSEVPCDLLSSEPSIVRLPRQRAIRGRVLTRGGTPIPDRTLYVVDGDGYHVPPTDSAGNFGIESSYSGQDSTFFLMSDSGDKNEIIYIGAWPRTRAPNVRVHGDEWPADTETGKLRLNFAGEERPPVSFFHEDGWCDNRIREEGQDLPEGELFLLVGRAFSGWEEEIVEVKIEAGEELLLELDPKRELELEILTPPDCYRIFVQVGEDSLALEGHEQQTISVPSGHEVVVLCEGDRTRRVVLPPITSNAVADLRPQSCLLPATHAQLLKSVARDHVSVHVSEESGGGKLEIYNSLETEPKQLAADEFQVQVPRGYSSLLRYRASGFAECWTAISSTESELMLEPTKLASLVFENRTGSEFRFESIEPDRLTALHPGPFSVIIRFEDGRRSLISLELTPGEHRTLTIRE